MVALHAAPAGTVELGPVTSDSPALSDQVSASASAGLERGGLQTPERLAAPDFRARVTIEHRDNIYRIAIAITDADGKPVASAEDVCEICGRAELAELVGDRAAVLAAQALRVLEEPPVLLIETDPPGSAVWIDGVEVGSTPYEHDIAPGEHTIEVRKPGYLPQRRTLALESGVRRDVRIDLHPEPVEVAPQAERGRGLVIGGAVTTALGGALLGAGGALLGIDSRPVRSGCNPDPAGNCARLYDTRVGGVALSMIGAAAIAAGVGLLAGGLSLRARGRERVKPTATGIVVRF